MTCSGDIRAHIDAMPDDEILTTRDMLQYGCRRTVDKTLSRLVQIQVLLRVARGVFIKFGAPEPTPMQVAIVKARSFGKELVTHGQQIAREFQLTDTDGKPLLVYQVKGRSSSFVCLGQRIFMRGAVAKKMFGGETRVGKVVRALSFLGRDLDCNQLARAIALVDPGDLHKLIKAARWMSSWLADDVREALAFRRKSKPNLRAIAS